MVQGSQIELEVSTGQAPSGKIKMPGVIGLPKGQAQAILADAGLKVSVALVEVADPAQIDRVVGQVPQCDGLGRIDRHHKRRKA